MNLQIINEACSEHNEMRKKLKCIPTELKTMYYSDNQSNSIHVTASNQVSKLLSENHEIIKVRAWLEMKKL